MVVVMIRSVTVTNYLGESMKLDLTRPDLSGFIVEKITGLGPGKADINVTEMSTTDGGRFNSARLPKRNIVINLRFYNWMKNKSIEDLRKLSYRYFPIKRELTLTIQTDNRTLEIKGNVESNEPDIFSKDEGTVISIICAEPSLYSAGSKGITSTAFSGIVPRFTFPFSNPVEEKTLIMGDIQNRTENVLIYKGDHDIGVTIRIHAIGEARNVTIHNLKTREQMKIDTDKLIAMTGSPIIAGDDINIVTLVGQKSITLIRDGVEINILNCLDRNSDWLRLVKGDNIIAYTVDTGSVNLQFVIENRTIYEGV